MARFLNTGWSQSLDFTAQEYSLCDFARIGPTGAYDPLPALKIEIILSLLRGELYIIPQSDKTCEMSR